MRIATVQLDYLPAYSAGHKDHLAYPLADTLKPGDMVSVGEIAKWRQALRDAYCEMMKRKFVAIVGTCHAHECDLIVFPEYSVPVECLETLRERSGAFACSILAGSHRASEAHPLYQEALPEIRDKNLNGQALAPLFTDNHAAVFRKATKSKYESELVVEPVAPGSRVIRVGDCSFRIWICSDYLEPPGADAEAPDIELVISFTPTLGDFAVRFQEETTDPLLRRAHAHQKAKGARAVVFANNADRGGTKVFFQNRDADPAILEAADGTYGECVIDANHVTRCGLQPGVEGIVIVDAVRGGAGLALKQHTIIPIAYCSAPDDSAANELSEFIDEYLRREIVSRKKAFLRLRLSYMAARAATLGNKLLDDKLRHVQADLESITSQDSLDRLVAGVCILHEEVPSLHRWMDRASRLTAELFLPLANRGGAVVAPTRNGVGHSGTAQVVRRASASAVPREDRLWLSEAFVEGVVQSRSGSAASEFGVRLIKHLLERQLGDDAIRVASHLQNLRPHATFAIVDDLLGVLQQPGETPTARANEAIQRCERFLKLRVEAQAALQEVCRACQPLSSKKLLVYGYSESVFVLLSAIREPKPPVVVAECRNRADVTAGPACAQRVKALGFQVSYVTDATIAHALSAGHPPVDTVLMGFNLAGPDGIVNSIGSLGAAVLAKQFRARVIFVGYGHKLLDGAKWESLRNRALEGPRSVGWQGERVPPELVGIRIVDPASDVVPWQFVDQVITDRVEFDFVSFYKTDTADNRAPRAGQ